MITGRCTSECDTDASVSSGERPHAFHVFTFPRTTKSHAVVVTGWRHTHAARAALRHCDVFAEKRALDALIFFIKINHELKSTVILRDGN